MNASFNLLKNILNIALLFSAILWLIILIIFLSVLLGKGGDFGLENIFTEIDLQSNTAKIVMLSYFLLGYAVIIYIISILRKLVLSFSNERLFTKFQTAGFNLVGRLIVWLVILSTISEFLIKMFLIKRIEYRISFPEFWLFLALGIFFMVLGQVFEKARLLREENELTV